MTHYPNYSLSNYFMKSPNKAFFPPNKLPFPLRG